jgi:hypothetical protein
MFLLSEIKYPRKIGMCCGQSLPLFSTYFTYSDMHIFILPGYKGDEKQE